MDLKAIVAETRLTIAQLEAAHDTPISEIRRSVRAWLRIVVRLRGDGTWGAGWYTVPDAGRELLQLLNAIEIVEGPPSRDGTHNRFLRLTGVGVVLRDIVLTESE